MSVVAHPLRDPAIIPDILNRAESKAYCVAENSFLQIHIRKAKKAAEPSPPQKDSIVDAAYIL